MAFAIILSVTVAATFILIKPLKKFPAIFYCLSVLAVVLFIVSAYVDFPRTIWSPLFVLMRKCSLPLAVFCIVMFIGVLPENSKIKKMLRPVRAQLSIIACILSLGHVVVYVCSYVPRLALGNSFELHMMISFVIAFVLFVLLMVLGITSFKHVKSRMDAAFWTGVQKWSYVFFALVYIHLLFVLLPSAMNNGFVAQTSLIVYSTVFVLYAVLRLVRAYKERDSKLQFKCPLSKNTLSF